MQQQNPPRKEKILLGGLFLLFDKLGFVFLIVSDGLLFPSAEKVGKNAA